VNNGVQTDKIIGRLEVNIQTLIKYTVTCF